MSLDRVAQDYPRVAYIWAIRRAPRHDANNRPRADRAAPTERSPLLQVPDAAPPDPERAPRATPGPAL
jgi:hypothetical protein